MSCLVSFVISLFASNHSVPFFPELDIPEDEKNLLLELQAVDDSDGYEKFKLLPEKLYDLVIDELVLYREHQLKGSRMTARARGQDIRFTTGRIAEEVRSVRQTQCRRLTDPGDSSMLSILDVRRRRFSLSFVLIGRMFTTRSIGPTRRPGNISRPFSSATFTTLRLSLRHTPFPECRRLQRMQTLVMFNTKARSGMLFVLV